MSGTVIVFSAKAYIAARWDASSNPALWLKAAKLEPGNAEYWRHAGLLLQWDLNPSDVRDGTHFLQIATKVNPLSADVWMDLADTYATAGRYEMSSDRTGTLLIWIVPRAPAQPATGELQGIDAPAYPTLSSAKKDCFL